MSKNQRQDEILKFVDRAGTVTVAEIMETMKVSDMTVRRDLIELENQGKLTRVFGGAKSNKVQQYRDQANCCQESCPAYRGGRHYLSRSWNIGRSAS